jgi:hypothetical protein
VSDQITILAVSELKPTYYDFCFADASCNACCWLARNTFAGITHSGDILNGRDLLDYVKINKESLTEKEICVFISGYQITQITRFLGTSPALLVADHVDKVIPKLVFFFAGINVLLADSLYHPSTFGRSHDWRRDYLLPIGNKA